MKHYLEEMVQHLITSNSEQASASFGHYLIHKTKTIINEQWNNRQPPEFNAKGDGKGNVMVSITGCSDCDTLINHIRSLCKQYGVPCNLNVRNNIIQGQMGLGDFRNETELTNFVQRELNRL